MKDLLNKPNKETKCNLCGSRNIKLLYKKDTFNILKCSSCKFIFNEKWDIPSVEMSLLQNGILNIDKIKTIFEREKGIYFSRFSRELEEISKFKKCGKILDVGCAYGYFLKLANENGWETYGIDINKNSVAYCRQYLSLNVIHGELIENKYPEKYFDVITMFHVLEHIPNLHQTFSITKKILKPDGLLMIDVPNINDLRRLWFKQDWAQFQKQHLWYFSKGTIKFLLQKYGFKIIRIKLHGGSEIVFALDKKFKINIKDFVVKYLKYLIPIRNIVLGVLNNLGFNEDIKIYAKNINN